MDKVAKELKLYFEDLNDEFIIHSSLLDEQDIDETDLYYVPISTYDDSHHEFINGCDEFGLKHINIVTQEKEWDRMKSFMLGKIPNYHKYLNTIIRSISEKKIMDPDYISKTGDHLCFWDRLHFEYINMCPDELKTNPNTDQLYAWQDVDTLCNICFKNERTIFSICGNGHTVCHNCYSKLTSCPFCRVMYDKNISWNSPKRRIL